MMLQQESLQCAEQAHYVSKKAAFSKKQPEMKIYRVKRCMDPIPLDSQDLILMDIFIFRDLGSAVSENTSPCRYVPRSCGSTWRSAGLVLVNAPRSLALSIRRIISNPKERQRHHFYGRV